MSEAENPMQVVETGIRAKYPALYVVSHEEGRVMAELADVAKSLQYRLMLWSLSGGLRERVLDEAKIASSGHYANVQAEMMDPVAILEYVEKFDGSAMFVLADYHEFLDGDVMVRRKFREVADGLRTKQKAMLVLSPVQTVPAVLEKVLTIVDVQTPNREQLTERLGRVEVRLKQKSSKAKFLVALDADSRERLINAALGLTRQEFDMVLGRSLVQHKCLDERTIALVANEKRQIVRRSGLMEFYDSNEMMKDVGGLDLLKSWLRKRKKAFTQEARDYGLPQPKGVLLVGVQGCGKSLAAKAAAREWNLPMLRLDMGALFGGLVGESEANARKAIGVAETLSPCVLWLDEIEKGMSGMQSSGSSDGGTTARVFQTFLTWMNEKTEPVFVFATANDVTSLPPELLRKGRFDEIFAVDLPVAAERTEILEIHLRKRKRDGEKFELAEIAEVTDGFSGAELEALVVDAMFESFDAARELETADIVTAAKHTVPLSKTMEEKISGLRKWASTRARKSSSLSHDISAPGDVGDDLDVFDG